MRDAFISELEELARMDSRLVVLSGDIGNRMFDRFKQQHPDRFYNCGIAEANMTGVAAGLALCGLRPVTYTIAAFNTLRCLEQIRVDLCYHNLPVILVGVGAGLSYAELGPTHHACEDIAILRSLPGMTILCPSDPVETRICLQAALKANGPVYIRLGKKGEPVLYGNRPNLEIGRSIALRRGGRICLLSCGTVLTEVMSAAAKLEEQGIPASVISMPCVKPLDVTCLQEVFAAHELVVTVEEHTLAGGFSGAVAEWLADQVEPYAPLLRLGTPDAFFARAGSQAYARRELGLTGEMIAARVLQRYRFLSEREI